MTREYKTMKKHLIAKIFILIAALFGSLITSVNATEKPIQVVSFITSDKITIKASFAKPESISEKQESGELPAVIFLHQGGSSKSEWTSLPLFQQIVDNNMIALAIDIRGHGESSGKADFSTIFNDPNQSPRDLDAAIKYLIDTNLVDSDRIAVVGASMGANLASLAAGKESVHVKTAVAMSGKTSAVYNLAGIGKSKMKFKSLFLIASELEQGGRRAGWAKEIFDLTEKPKQLEIVKGSSQHGVSVFKDDPSLQERILKWLLETL